MDNMMDIEEINGNCHPPQYTIYFENEEYKFHFQNDFCDLDKNNKLIDIINILYQFSEDDIEYNFKIYISLKEYIDNINSSYILTKLLLFIDYYSERLNITDNFEITKYKKSIKKRFLYIEILQLQYIKLSQPEINQILLV
jgi:hypothetical protein